jgi:hypothetical protein
MKLGFRLLAGMPFAGAPRAQPHALKMKYLISLKSALRAGPAARDGLFRRLRGSLPDRLCLWQSRLGQATIPVPSLGVAEESGPNP